MRICVLYFICTILLLKNCEINCWKSFEPDLFDLVEEIGQNFYDFFGVQKNADLNEIRKAYKKLSLKFHPDRNNEPNAEDMFRKIVGVHEILKDEEKRKRYDEILEFGLPDWRQPIYYYRRAKKLTFTELILAISVVIVIGHYFVMWAQYFERRLCLDERLSETRKKLEKKEKKKNRNANMDEIDKALNQAYDLLPSPSFKKTLPIRLVLWLYSNKLFIPAIYALLKARLERKVEIKHSDDENDDAEEEERELAKRLERKRLVNELNPKKSEYSTYATSVTYTTTVTKRDGIEQDEVETTATTKKSIENWTDAEKALLIKAIQRYPGGTPDRWNTISDYVNRPANQCIQMEKILKTNLKASSNPIQTRNAVNNHEPLISDDIMTQRDCDESITEQKKSDWNQEQQKQLEMALKSVSKDVPDRWDRIAQLVPGKNKDECMQRFKALCQTLSKNKK